jgi:1-deoxy-D-xylulose-5-phosphate reductoisomerase
MSALPDESERPMAARHQRVTVLGATGSVGRATLDVMACHPGRFALDAITAHRDAEGLAALAIQHGARFAVVADPALYSTLRAALAGTGIEVAAGPDAVIAAACRPVDRVMAAIVGAAGLAPTLAAIARGATVAFANKEVLVSAGLLVLDLVARSGAKLLPVDSEHNAIFQVFSGRRDDITRLILTASGGPFRTTDLAEMARATPAMALRHPVWSMGAKISIDSATMMNKGLEVIEAAYLFGMPEPAIEVMVHPQSLVHSMVEYVDGSMLAQLGAPDMRTPIANALAWPDRVAVPVARLSVRDLAQLTFEEPDLERFPALRLARAALSAGNSAPNVLNAANEVAVAAFLAERIGFLDIAAIVDATLTCMDSPAPRHLDDVIAVDQEARRHAEAFVRKRAQ